MDMNSMEFERPCHPKTKASLLAKWSFWWLKDLFKLGLQRSIEEKDIYQTLPEHDSARLLNVFSTEWDKEKQRKQPSLFNVIFRVFVKKIIWLSLCYSFVDITLRSIQPLCLGGLVMYFSQSYASNGTRAISEQSNSTVNVISREFGYLYAGGILTCSFISMLIVTPFSLYAVQMGLRIHSTCRSMVYKKTLQITKSVSFDELNGRVINLMSTDVACFDYSMYFVQFLWKGPIELAVFGYLIYLEIGFYGWIGLGFILCFVPIQLWMGKMAATFRLRTAKRTDKRVKVMNEVIQGIQVIKMYAWETSFASLVDKIRKKELKAVRGTNLIRGILTSFNMVPRVSIFLSLASYVYCGNVFEAKQVFIVTAYFNFLYNSMMHNWPMALTSLAECYVSIKRIEAYLMEQESKFDCRNNVEEAVEHVALLKKSNQNHLEIVDDLNSSSKSFGSKIQFINHHRRNQENNIAETKGVVFENATALWRTEDDNCKIGLKNITLNMNSLSVIIGSVGAGKSTLLHTILGDLELDNGQLRINGSVSYASQEPWLFEANVRQNILFTEEYNENRYNEVIRVCALERDLELLVHGDYTIVSERGINLSGGQRARINLARAIYRQADIYLLDDPLSAVDTHVGKHIFENCIKGFLKNKVCILVTHQLQYLTEVNDIILLNSGTLAIHGNLNQLKNSDYKSFLWMTGASSDETEKNDENSNEIATSIFEEIKERQQHERQALLKEDQSVGAIGFHVFKAFFVAVESKFLIICVLAVLVIEQISTSAIDLFVSKWVNWESAVQTRLIHNGSELDGSLQTVALTTNLSETEVPLMESMLSDDKIDSERFEYVYTYTVVMCFILYLVVQRGVTFFYMCLRASRRLHDKLFRGIIHAPMSFFNTNSSGRIINRFSKDIAGIDATLPVCLYESFFFVLQALGNMILVSITNHWLLVPTCVLLISFCTLRQIYIQTGRCVKRIESLTRSPIYSHTNATISGLATIRACNAEQILIKEFNAHQDVNVSAGYLFYASARALSLWLDASCFLYMIAVIITFFIFDSYSVGGNVGLAITQIIYLSTLSQWGMRETTELENQMTFVERVDEYSTLKSEPESEPKHDPAKGWPEQGDIQFDHLTLKYSAHSEPVLKQINLSIKSKEKIGIVGRTGAGKSSIIQALFRLAHNEGIIKINGIDISTLGLHDLRQRISIIPQDPILFSGTMRDNLDPFQTATDDELWNALQWAELKSTISNLPGGLDCKMSDSGSNFSMGQRQLVCLARAILRNNKILILDEATANVDADTDKFIQTTIREKFADCTVLTIAHRLHTVMDSDKVLVMDAGEIAEYDHPFKLLQRPNGFLRKLVNETESSTAAQLLEIARQSYKQKVNGQTFQ